MANSTGGSSANAVIDLDLESADEDELESSSQATDLVMTDAGHIGGSLSLNCAIWSL